MSYSVKARLYSIAKRLQVGRVLRYAELWARYGLRRLQLALAGQRASAGAGSGAFAARLSCLDMATARRAAVSSWFPLDLTNTGLHAAILEEIAAARPDLGLTPDIRGCLARLKRAPDLAAAVDAEAASGGAPKTINTALYVLLLRRLPAPSEAPMIASRHPRHALIAIISGDEFRKQGRRTSAD